MAPAGRHAGGARCGGGMVGGLLGARGDCGREHSAVLARLAGRGTDHSQEQAAYHQKSSQQCDRHHESSNNGAGSQG
jgi:hypothetical protein